MGDKPRVVVAMSGGVDSSVAAGLLVEQGYDVIGMMLRLWSEPGLESFNRCCTPEAMSLARRVSAQLEIPFYVLDVREVFEEKIVQFFMDGYRQGVTPNPCMMCNRYIRFGTLLDRAISLGAEFLATGHYARVGHENGRSRLYRGIDRKKDQSYVLSILNQGQLSKALFPIGEYPKTEVRRLAEKLGLPAAQRKDSQDLCFLAGGDYRDFLVRHAPEVERPGPIRSVDGEMLGDHKGLAFYTIGQRKGLGIQTSAPHYVVEKDMRSNTLIVGERSRLGKSSLLASQANWIAGSPPAAPIRGQVKVRYTAREISGTVTPITADSFRVDLDESLIDLTPGQSAVIFQGEEVIGGGFIKKTGLEHDWSGQ